MANKTWSNVPTAIVFNEIVTGVNHHYYALNLAQDFEKAINELCNDIKGLFVKQSKRNQAVAESIIQSVNWLEIADYIREKERINDNPVSIKRWRN